MMPVRFAEHYWKNLSVRRYVAVFLFVGAVAGQVYLANMPLQIDFAAMDFGTTDRGTIQADFRQQLVIHRPNLSPSTNTLLAYNGQPNEVVDIYFERAQLSSQTARFLTALGLSPPSTAGPISYADSGTEPGSGEPCRTAMSVEMSPKSANSIHLFQQEKLDAKRYRTLELKAIGAEFLVKMNTVTPENGDPQATGCQKLLRAEEWRQSLGPSIPVTVMVPPDSGFRFRVQSVARDFSSSDGDFFKMEPIQASSVEVRPLESAASSAVSALRLNGPDEKTPLHVDSLQVGLGRLQLKVLGRGWVEMNGEGVTYNLLERLQKFPTVSFLIGLADATLINWLKVLFWRPGWKGKSRRKKSQSNSVRDRSRERKP